MQPLSLVHVSIWTGRFYWTTNMSTSLKFCIFSTAAFGDVFAGIGVREPQPTASEAFTKFGEAHREIEKYAIKMLKTAKPVRWEEGGGGYSGLTVVWYPCIKLL